MRRMPRRSIEQSPASPVVMRLRFRFAERIACNGDTCKQPERIEFEGNIIEPLCGVDFQESKQTSVDLWLSYLA